MSSKKKEGKQAKPPKSGDQLSASAGLPKVSSSNIPSPTSPKSPTSDTPRRPSNIFKGIGMGALKGLGVSMDAEGNKCLSGGSLAPTFRSTAAGSRRHISQATNDRNKALDQRAKALALCSQIEGRINEKKSFHSRMSSSDLEVGNGNHVVGGVVVDSKALAIEIENVAAELRNLLNGVDSGNDRMATANTNGDGEKGDGKARDDDDEENTLHSRLMRYRYVRKIEAPPPPLEPLEECTKEVKAVDKMEANLSKFRISWSKNAQERAQHWNREEAERIDSARCRREEALHRAEEKLAASWEDKESRCGRVESLRAAQVEKIRLQAAVREDRLAQVRSKRAEEQFQREQRLQETLAAQFQAFSYAAPLPKISSSPRGGSTKKKNHHESASGQSPEPGASPGATFKRQSSFKANADGGAEDSANIANADEEIAEADGAAAAAADNVEQDEVVDPDEDVLGFWGLSDADIAEATEPSRDRPKKIAEGEEA
eukprot:TRINITY_DN3030_c1_g2_i1.p1 TRINITY_DN3030_c1_g2~~TRINITY_DN3030_c1_g2_i1.p1  ORF type:complete len:487 (+),score=123.98 TRINITY_DN3030_c1_g2_i1:74-1534(+)